MLAYYFDMALRNIRRNGTLSALMVLAIAVGIGASMTTLTVMHLLARDPLPGRSARLFYPQVNPTPKGYEGGDEPPDVMDYRSAMDLWRAGRADRQTLIVDSQLRVTAPDARTPPLMGQMLSTTADFFPMFDVPFLYGSGWSADDDAKQAHVAVISFDTNRRLFGGANSVGRTVRLRDTSVRIVGVLDTWRPSPLFYDVAAGRFAHGDTADFYGKVQDVMTPLSTGLQINDGHFQQFDCWALAPVPGHLQEAPCVWVKLWVQLDTPARVAAYRDFLAGYAAQQKALGRYEVAEGTRLRSLMAWLDYNGVVPSDVQLQTNLAFAFLAICLFNATGLLLANFLRRSGEIGVRRALGATRQAIFVQCFVEAGVIGAFGGFGGWLLTLAGLWLVRQQPVAYADMAHIDVAMFAVTFLLAILSSLLAGCFPALRASRVPPALQLKTLG
ncbi:ABC transporter permease [Luteibacter sp. PPL201]|jgi:putative ABC transport system permease protein|uniref:ABC transporter permease n=1 Tax=Luteibacter sahnii TaxID=3021977 RepID=A0ABT6BB89_9GAMM|nr:ABC transporter permease [Luteibacter sp. PPL193]MDY1549438.1 ABC transporter permease [Luteibacter sp. PPL193]